MRVLAHMAKEKHILPVLEAFLAFDKGLHEINYLITDFEPFEDKRDDTLHINEYGRVNLAYKMEAARATAIKMNYDYIFNVEDDNLIPEDAFLKLLDSEKSLISGMYRYRPSQRVNTPLMPETFESRKNFKDSDLLTGVQPAFLIPWGCTLFAKEVFEKVAFSPGLDGDYNRRCRENNISRWVHTDLHVGHFDVDAEGGILEIKV